MAFVIDDIVKGVGSVADLASGILDRFFPKQMTEAEKAAAREGIERRLQEYITTREAYQRDIMVAELNQEDRFTKRARPMVVYIGLAFIGLTSVVMPSAAWVMAFMGRAIPDLPSLTLPEEFWWAWGGIVGTYAIGRSFEKKGGSVRDSVTGALLGK